MGERFAGRVALITGGGRGLGREYALLLVSEGARVVVNDLGGDRHGSRTGSDVASEVVEEIRAAGGEAVADGHDVVDDARDVVGAAVDAWGRVDLVVNNAGISGGGEIDQIPVADYDRMIDVHYRGTVAVCRAAWPLLREQRYGRIVNTSSGSFMGLPSTSAYISAKAAVMGLTRALAHDGARHDVKVNAVMPIAYTRLTREIPSETFRSFLETRFAPATVAPFVAALLTTEVPCTGETFSVGGGIAARVVLATVPGHVSTAHSVDDYLAHFDEILSTDGLFVPAGSMDEIAFRSGQVGANLDNPTFAPS
jgi:NAD(P)-dependent dehydrogenase (short-subunit alcohol dehydrogenase family)